MPMLVVQRPSLHVPIQLHRRQRQRENPHLPHSVTKTNLVLRRAVDVLLPPRVQELGHLWVGHVVHNETRDPDSELRRGGGDEMLLQLREIMFPHQRRSRGAQRRVAVGVGRLRRVHVVGRLCIPSASQVVQLLPFRPRLDVLAWPRPVLHPPPLAPAVLVHAEVLPEEVLPAVLVGHVQRVLQFVVHPTLFPLAVRLVKRKTTRFLRQRAEPHGRVLAQQLVVAVQPDHEFAFRQRWIDRQPVELHLVVLGEVERVRVALDAVGPVRCVLLVERCRNDRPHGACEVLIGEQVRIALQVLRREVPRRRLVRTKHRRQDRAALRFPCCRHCAFHQLGVHNLPPAEQHVVRTAAHVCYRDRDHTGAEHADRQCHFLRFLHVVLVSLQNQRPPLLLSSACHLSVNAELHHCASSALAAVSPPTRPLNKIKFVLQCPKCSAACWIRCTSLTLRCGAYPTRGGGVYG
eukprot:PhM_4_TR9620/c0_g1_i1/m.22859